MLKTNYQVGELPHSEYPRPQFERQSYLILNGLWDFTKVKQNENEYNFDKKILVPFSPETLNSGLEQGFTLNDDEKLVYKRTFSLNESLLKGTTMLHFGAVDQECNVFVNGEKVGYHRGGYTPFSFDVTSSVKNGENQIVVECVDLTEKSHGARGKQSSNAGKIWYTKQSGIWQTVWLESMPKNYIRDITIKTDTKTNTVKIKADYDGEIKLTVYDGIEPIIDKTFSGEVELKYDYTWWSPENPKLYNIVLVADSGDKVRSYFGVRSFDVDVDKKDKRRLFLNGKPYFMNGVLDQGYWSDGLLTPPSDKAMSNEITLIKSMGFNMIRKHIKLEPMRWYYHADKVGLIVWQDFVNGGGEYKFNHIATFPFLGFHHKDTDYKYFSRENEDGRKEFISSVHETIKTLKNVTSIGVYVPFNEGWGQFDSVDITELVLSLDDTRIIDSVSGWHDQGKKKTTLKSLHTYYTPLKVPKDKRAVVLSEFGGYSIKTDGHVFSQKEFGYKVFKDSKEYANAVKKLFIKKLKPLIKKGLSASVYTQVSDVEEEINGLVTYDRKVIKIPVEFIKEINLEIEKEANCIE